MQFVLAFPIIPSHGVIKDKKMVLQVILLLVMFFLYLHCWY